MDYKELIAAGHVHDASGITNPEDYDWQPTNGIYYPVKKDGLIDKEQFNKLLDDAYNKGVEASIKFCESQKAIYSMIDPRSPVPMVIDSIVKTLAHFKKV